MEEQDRDWLAMQGLHSVRTAICCAVFGLGALLSPAIQFTSNARQRASDKFSCPGPRPDGDDAEYVAYDGEAQ